MQRARRRDTAPELRLRRELHRRGLRYRVNLRVVPGHRSRTIDVVFTRARLAVFVDGCFWHGCSDHGRRPETNEWYWSGKIERNIARDRDTTARLEDAGWKVIRVWEHEDPGDAAERVAAVLTATHS
jgi:DNA mismatch endonuclease (patch repair protein)